MNAPNPDAWRHRNLGRLLHAALRRFESRVLEHLRAAGHGELSASHVQATRHLDRDGTRLTELARRAAMTKQSMSELVAQLERAGLVTRERDPSDTRARLIRFTPAGEAWLSAFGNAVAAAEAEIATQIGSDTLARLKHDLEHCNPGHDDGLGHDTPGERPH